MPLYEYQCQACGRRLERIQKFSDPPLEVCPFCGGRLEKLLSSPAIQFKGSGWYVTDYARKSEKPAAESTGKDSASQAADSSDKSKSDQRDSSESKPAGDVGSSKAAGAGGSATSTSPKPAPPNKDT